MPHISVYLDNRTMAILQRVSVAQGRTVEQIAEAAIEGEAISHLPGGNRHMHFGDDRPTLNCGGVEVPYRIATDGSMHFD